MLALLLQKIPNKFKTSGYNLARVCVMRARPLRSVRASSPAVSAAGDFKFTYCSNCHPERATSERRDTRGDGAEQVLLSFWFGHYLCSAAAGSTR